MNEIVKIQRRKSTKNSVSLFLTIPTEYEKQLNDVTHMKVTINDQGHLEYKPA